MKVITKSQGGIAISCRKNVYFEKGETLGIGDKRNIKNENDKGLTEKNLLRLIELNLAEDVTKVKKSKSTTVNYKDLSKSELDVYAKKEYGINLDKRQSLEKMTEELEHFIENSDDSKDL